MPEPPSARADRARSSMSKTRARRQAHRESYIFRSAHPGRWCLGRITEMGLVYYASFANARRALAAWRAERVRELMGVTDRNDSCAPR